MPTKVEDAINSSIALLDYILSSLEYEKKDEYLISSLRSIQYILKEALNSEQIN